MNPAASLAAQLEMYRGWTYAPTVGGARDCRYPTPVPGPVHTRRPPPKQSDCVCYVEGVVLGACYSSGVEVDWSKDRHNLALIAGQEAAAALRAVRGGFVASQLEQRLLFGPVHALIEAGLA